MAARKKTAKKAPAKPAKARKTSRTATPAKKKAAPAKKAPAKRPASAAAKPKPKPSITAKPVAKPAAKPVASAKPPEPRPKAPPVGAVGVEEVLLSHVMALRPRIHVGFKPSAFMDAKRALADQRYATIQDAARAVAEKAIEISNEFSPRSPFERQ